MISLGKGCFVGSGVSILANVAVDDSVIICAGSVAKNDVPSN